MKKIVISHKELAIRMLQGAKSRIHYGGEYFLCCALEAIAKDMREEYHRYPAEIQRVIHTYAQLVGWVGALLGPDHRTLESWALHHSESEYQRALDNWSEVRGAWIDWMISELRGLK